MRTILLYLCILTVTVPSKGQLLRTREWKAGSYYDTLNKKTTGLVAWDIPSTTIFKSQDYIWFKVNNESQKVKISTLDIKAFTLGTDSFVVSKTIQYTPVLQVLINENVKLYKWTTKAGMAPGGAFRTGGAGMGLGPVSFSYRAADRVKYYCGTSPEDITVLNKKNSLI